MHCEDVAKADDEDCCQDAKQSRLTPSSVVKVVGMLSERKLWRLHVPSYTLFSVHRSDSSECRSGICYKGGL